MSPCHLCPLRRQPTPLFHMDSPAICSVLRHPRKGWGVFCDFFPYLPGVPAMYGILRHPSAKGWGIFRAFYPYLLEASPVCNVLRYPLVKGWGIYGNFFPYLAGTLPLHGFLRHPVSKGWGIFSAFYPYLLDASPVYNVLWYPFVKGWGIYGDFLPYLPEALPLYGPLRHPTSKGMGVFRDFYPYLLDGTRPLRHSLSAFKSSPFAHQAGLPYSTPFFCTGRSCKCLPYTTAPFSVRNGLASASRTERCRFSVPHVSASGSRTTEGPFSVPDGESPQGYRVLRLRRSNLNTNMPLESHFRARL